MSKAEITKEKSDSFVYIKSLKHHQYSRKHFNNGRAKEEKTFATNMAEKGSICLVYKELLQINLEKMITSMNNLIETISK